MNDFLNGFKAATNYTRTENNAITHRSSMSNLLDMFAMGGAYRNRSDADCITLFRKAFNENSVYAMKCLFYLRDVRGGQGERRFFRVVMRDLATWNEEAARRNMALIPLYGRWDDLYVFVGTPLEKDALQVIRNQLMLDVQCNTPSLLAKWLKSENTSSEESCRLGRITRKYLGMTPKQYRKTLSILRSRINILEKLMSENKWEEIEFDKIPSKAGMRYKNAFARHDIERIRAGVQTYAEFANDSTTKVNASVLNPADIAKEIFQFGPYSYHKPTDTQRKMWQKYWDNLKDYYNGKEANDLAIVDVSGSMTGTPMEAAVSMGAYIAERNNGAFKNHFITFSESPSLVEFEGVDIFDKFQRARRADWGMNTDLEAVFKMMLDTILRNNIPASEVPNTLYIFSDMEFDEGLYDGWQRTTSTKVNTLLENIAAEWKAFGLELPRVIFWNLDVRQDNIPALGGRFSYVSGFSMTMVEAILSGKDGLDLMMEKLDTDRYAAIH